MEPRKQLCGVPARKFEARQHWGAEWSDYARWVSPQALWRASLFEFKGVHLLLRFAHFVEFQLVREHLQAAERQEQLLHRHYKLNIKGALCSHQRQLHLLARLPLSPNLGRKKQQTTRVDAKCDWVSGQEVGPSLREWAHFWQVWLECVPRLTHGSHRLLL